MGLLLALVFDVCLLGSFVFLCGVLQEARVKAIRYFGFSGLIAFGVLALYQIERFCTKAVLESKFGDYWLFFKIPVVCVLLFLIVRFRRRVPQAIVALLLIASPLFPILMLSGLWSYSTVDLRRVADEKPSPMLPGGRLRPRLVWIIFDELDDRMLFAARPGSIEIPEFYRLRSQSIYGPARAPGKATLWSMPSFLLGKRVVTLKLDTSLLDVKFGKRDSFENAASLPNVFRSARIFGLNSGLTGWHHPYCRVFGSDLNDCSWASFGMRAIVVERLLRTRSFLRNALYLLNWQARWSVPILVEPTHWVASEPEESRMWRQEQIEDMRFIMGNALRMLRDPDLNLIFIHLPVPHPAGIWDTRAKKFTVENSTYFDNIALSDAALGQIRGEMEQMRDWDSSTVIVSSDHPYRTETWKATSFWKPEMARVTRNRQEIYVPFFLKLPGQRSAVQYKTEFNNVVTADLALQILKGQVKTSGDAVQWLDAHAAASLR